MTRILLYIAVILSAIASCKKSTFLDKKPNQSISEPVTLEDFQAVLDNSNLMNGFSNQAGIDPNFLLSGTDDYFYPDISFPSLAPEYKNIYTWNDDIYGLPLTNWDNIYKGIFYANVALDGLDKIQRTVENELAYDNIKGSALFFRARFFYQLVQVYAPHYNSATSNSDWGIVLRLKSDVNEILKRITVQQTYDQIVSDLREAVHLLPPISVSPYKTRPSKPAAYAMLAKTYLIMQDYTNANLHADSCLQIQDTLMDYNQFSSATLTSSARPISRTNPETIFYSTITSQFNGLNSGGRVDTLLYQSYNPDDKRKVVYFRQITSPSDVLFKGSYDGTAGFFTGIAVDEVYLIRAEARARLNMVQEAINDLNKLMIKRWRTGMFVPFMAVDATDALNKILTERRKELVQRGTRWTDLRRLNLGGAGIIVTRKINGQIYTLSPNDSRYTYLIPPKIIAFHPDMPQNPR